MNQANINAMRTVLVITGATVVVALTNFNPAIDVKAGVSAGTQTGESE